MRAAKVFLTAEWRDLAMLSFEIDPAVLLPLVPAGTELADWQGRTLVSVVGFRFLDARIWGLAIPWHRNFEEVNLRFYVRRKTYSQWRRGVVFVRELTPRRAVATVARAIYNENFTAVPMAHRVERDERNPAAVRGVSYHWTFRGRQNSLDLRVAGALQPPEAGSEARFITEHFWGYSRQRDGGTIEYRVDHPPWRIWPVREARLDCDAASLYGAGFAEALAAQPTSAWLTDGSAVRVFRGVRVPLDLSSQPAAKRPGTAIAEALPPGAAAKIGQPQATAARDFVAANLAHRGSQLARAHDSD